MKHFYRSDNMADIFTARGICKQLDVSPYRIKHSVTMIDTVTVELFFSSSNNVKRFSEKINEEIEKLESKIKKITGIKIECEVLAMILFYRKIEKRGFYVKISGFSYDDFHEIPFEIYC